MKDELRTFFRSGSQIWDIGPGNTRLPLGWGMSKGTLEHQGFTKSELEKYVKMGILGKTSGYPSKGKAVDTNGGVRTIYYFKTEELLRG